MYGGEDHQSLETLPCPLKTFHINIRYIYSDIQFAGCKYTGKMFIQTFIMYCFHFAASLTRSVCGRLQVIWNTSPSWSRGVSWRCWSTSMSGPAKNRSASQTSCFPCWSWFQKREPRLQNACATPGLPSSGDLQSLHLSSHSLQRLQQITFQFGHIRWLFISLLFFVSLFLDYFCFCYGNIAFVYDCVGSSPSVMMWGVK